MTVRTAPQHGPVGRPHPTTEVSALSVLDVQAAVRRARDEGTGASIRSTGLGTRTAPAGGVVTAGVRPSRSRSTPRRPGPRARC